MNDLRSLFLLDPDVVFLNHGSFGATPRPVFAAYQAWQRRLEAEPVQFLIRELPDLLAEARAALAAYLGVAAADLVYMPNATFAVNVVARSLPLGSGDELLTTNHEYGACENVWRFLSGKRGFTYRRQPLPFPLPEVPDLDEFLVDTFWRGVTPRTRVIFLSHITSATALRLPVAAICERARAEGILTVVDGAHAPGQIPLDLEAIGADFYLGNAHKWLCAPKGSAFLYTRPARQALIEPLVVGWGWGEERSLRFGSDYLDYLQWLGTNDLAAYLSVPSAIAFQADHGWPAVRERCHALLQEALARLSALTGLPSPYPDASLYRQMAVASLPPLADLAKFQMRLFDQFQVEIPCIEWQARQFIRISVQGYNREEDISVLETALGTLLPIFARL